jgi:FMN reductase
MSLSVKVIVANPSPASRTRRIAEILAGLLLAPGAAEIEVVELANYATELFDFGSEKVSALNRAVAASDLVFFATPTYKGAYTGLLKAFLDRYGTNGLAGVIAIPVQTGGTSAHSLAPNQVLVPLLLELGAIVPGGGLYVAMDKPDELEELIVAAAERYAGNLARLAALAEHVHGSTEADAAPA